MKNLNFKIGRFDNINDNNLEKEYAVIDCFIDGKYNATIRIDEDKNTIEWVEINPEYKGKGIYKMLLIAALNMTSCSELVSSNRNTLSNPAYKSWTNESNLSCETTVVVTLDGEKLLFEIQ